MVSRAEHEKRHRSSVSSDINHDSTLNHLLLLGAGKESTNGSSSMASRPLTIVGAMAIQSNRTDRVGFDNACCHGRSRG
jgi:hypothetical protein